MDEQILPLRIPLQEPDFIRLDLQKVYNHTFSTYSYYHKNVDYSQNPLNFSSYHPTDQIRLQKRLSLIQNAVQNQQLLTETPLTSA